MTTHSSSHVILATTSWRRYLAIVDAAGEANPGLRIAFADETLEIMSPSFDHERVVRLMEYLLTRAFDLSGVEAVSAGSTTYRRDDAQKGAEPDLCFYLDRPGVRVNRQIELNVDPAPDLVIEIDLTRERMSKRLIYAAFGVPELWTFDGRRLAAARLDGAQYRAVSASSVLPWLPLDALVARIERMHVENNARLRLEWDEHVRALLPTSDQR